MMRETDQAPTSNEEQAQSVEKLLLTSKEVCAALGLTRDKLFHLRKRGIIPFIRVSERRYYYPREELRAWIRANCQGGEATA